MRTMSNGPRRTCLASKPTLDSMKSPTMTLVETRRCTRVAVVSQSAIVARS